MGEKENKQSFWAGSPGKVTQWQPFVHQGSGCYSTDLTSSQVEIFSGYIAVFHILYLSFLLMNEVDPVASA